MEFFANLLKQEPIYTHVIPPICFHMLPKVFSYFSSNIILSIYTKIKASSIYFLTANN